MPHNTDDEHKRKYVELERLIQQRIEFEKAQKQDNFSPYALHATDINFCDVHSRSLLWYASALGDLRKVKELIEAGAVVNLHKTDTFDVSSPPIVIALSNGHLDVAKYLFEKGAICHKASLNLCKGETVRKWYADELQQAARILSQHPDVLDEAKDTSSLQDSDVRKVDQFFKKKSKKSKKSTELSLLLALAEIGDIEFIHHVLRLSEISLREMRLIFINAARYGQLEVMQLLMKHDNSLIHAIIPYQPLPLNVALVNKHDHVVQYLLSQNIDVNAQDNRKVSALMVALLESDESLVKQLLEKNADLSLVDISGRTALHYAARASDSAAKLVLDTAVGKRMLDQEDIYGRKPMDVAIENHNDKVVTLFGLYGHDKRADSTKQSVVDISQHNVMSKMFYYLKLNYRDVDSFSKKGYCKGVSLIAQLRNMSEYYFDTLRLMANWDGKQESLDESFSDIPQSQYYQNLGGLFEQWINDITWGQIDFKKLNITIAQSTPELVEVISDNQLHSICYLASHDLNKEQVREILLYFSRMPPLTRLEIFSANHVTNVYKKNENTMIFYDPNFPRETTPVLSVDELLKRVMDWQYILVKSYQEKLTFLAHFFYFQQDLSAIKLDDFSIFLPAEFPVNRRQANGFQSKSPHHFTHLHVAVMTKSIAALKRLIRDDHCNINAKDCFGKTAFDVALDAGDVQAVEVLLDLPDAKMKHMFSPLLIRAYQKGVFKSSDQINIPTLFRVAMAQPDFALAKQLFSQYQEELMKETLLSDELIKAMSASADEKVDFLLDLGASVTRVDAYGRTPLKKVFSQNKYYYSKIISKLKDINESDELGFSAIHYAAEAQEVTLLVDLLKRGADVMKKSNDGRTPYQMSNTRHIAVDRGQAASLFSELKANFKNKRIETRLLIINAFDLAKENDRLQLMNILRDTNESNKVYEMAAARSDSSISQKELLDPLILMLSHGEFDKAGLLLKHGANINTVTNKKQTILMLFVQSDQDVKPHLEFIMKYNPDLNIADKTGKTVLDMAAHSNNEAVKQVFEPYLAKNIPKK